MFSHEDDKGVEAAVSAAKKTRKEIWNAGIQEIRIGSGFFRDFLVSRFVFLACLLIIRD